MKIRPNVVTHLYIREDGWTVADIQQIITENFRSQDTVVALRLDSDELFIRVRLADD